MVFDSALSKKKLGVKTVRYECEIEVKNYYFLLPAMLYIQYIFKHLCEFATICKNDLTR
jgi:hypothetical protein